MHSQDFQKAKLGEFQNAPDKLLKKTTVILYVLNLLINELQLQLHTKTKYTKTNSKLSRRPYI